MPDLPDDISTAWDDWLDGTGDEAGAGALLTWIDRHPDALPGLQRDAAMQLALGYALADESCGARLRSAVMARVRAPDQPAGTGAFARRVMTRVRTRAHAPRWHAPALASAALIAIAFAWYVATWGSGGAIAPPRDATTAPAAAPASRGPMVTARAGLVEVGGKGLARGATATLPTDGTVTVAAGGSADVRLPDGSVLSLFEDARMRATSDSWHLERGAVSVEASPQPPGHRLTIATAHATVSVVGTAFRVETGADATWVSVVHGRVVVAAGSMERALEAGQSAVADSGGVALAGPQRALALADGAPNDLFDPVVLITQSGTFHGLDLARFTYRPSGRATAQFADVAWPVAIAPEERHATVWLRPLSVEPAAHMDGTIVAITAGLDDCDYLLAERHVAAGERAWLRIEADLGAGTLNWTRPGAVAQPLRPEAIRRLSLRAYCGHIDGVVTVPVIGR